jgi:hypothetical protein
MLVPIPPHARYLTFTRPVTGAYFWCPGMRRGRLDLAPLGL